MSLEEEESKRFKYLDVHNILLIKTSKNGLHCQRERIYNILKLGVNVRSSP